MPQKKNQIPHAKAQLHPRNKHHGRYDFNALVDVCAELKPFVEKNKFGSDSINFFNPDAVKMLNTALLMHHYSISSWHIPTAYLCPPIPGRADYIHYVADLLGENRAKIPTGERVTALDIGTGANCIYPIIGAVEYGWQFIGTDIDKIAISAAKKTIAANKNLRGKIDLRLQPLENNIFKGILYEDEKVDITICNPPFHKSAEDATAGSIRKESNLKQVKITKPTLNFGGTGNELWCNGGEERFVRNMIYESAHFADSCLWFTTLISKEPNVKRAYQELKKVKAKDVRTIHMGQGNKTSRIIAWSFLTKLQQEEWFD